MNNRVKQVLNVILDKFKSGDIPEALAFSMYPIPEIPSAKWSLMNRTLMFLSGTMDGRGYKQWQQVDRFVRKGSKAFHILVPFIRKNKDEEGDDRQFLIGFGCRPVFRRTLTFCARYFERRIEERSRPASRNCGGIIKPLPMSISRKDR